MYAHTDETYANTSNMCAPANEKFAHTSGNFTRVGEKHDHTSKKDTYDAYAREKYAQTSKKYAHTCEKYAHTQKRETRMASEISTSLRRVVDRGWGWGLYVVGVFLSALGEVLPVRV